MNELEAHINRIVASIAAEPGRKLEIRRELLTHLRDALREEQLRTRNADDAIETALNRLGDPQQLQREIQASIPFSDVLMQAVRRAALCLTLLVFVSLPRLLVATFDTDLTNQRDTLSVVAMSLRQQSAPLLAADVLIAANVFVISLLHYWISIRHDLTARPIAGRFVWGLSSTLIVLASGSLFSLLITGSLSLSWEFCVRWIAIALAVSIAVPLVVPLAGGEIRRYRNWQRCLALANE